MKHVRKVLTLMLSAVMMMALTINAFAASIEITHDETYDEYVDPADSEPRVYSAYKVFDANYVELSGSNTQDDKDDFTYEPGDAAVSYSMEADNPWVDVMTAAGQTWFDVKEDANGNYIVTPKEGQYEDSAAAKAFAEYLAANIPDDATATDVTVDGGAVTVDPGYYLIIAKDGKDATTIVALVTTDVEMVEKNTYIGSKKETEQTSYTVGDIIEYTATISIPADTALTVEDGSGYKAGHGPIIVHDEMDAVLAFDPDSVTASPAVDFEVVTEPEDDCTFEIVFPVTEDILGQDVVFTYSAELTSAAVNPDTGFINKLFAENNGYKTVPTEPVVYTFDFNFEKTFVGSEDPDLTATFQLEDEEGNVFYLLKLSDGKYVICGEDEDGAVTEIESANNAAIQVVGLKAGTYSLVELSTSAGYNLLDGPATVVITDTSTVDEDTGEVTNISHTVTIDGASSTAEDPALIENQSGTVLPSTGGIGTTIFYTLGTILVLGSGIVLVSKRRMGAN